MKNVCKVAFNDYVGSVKELYSYKVWLSMIHRCYDEKVQNKQPRYIGCTVCDEWLYFSNFKKWFDERYTSDDLELDKDILIEGNKIYSPQTCVLIPRRINLFMTNKKKTNTSGYVGVCWDRKKWRVQINDFTTSKSKYLGLFTDIEEASKKYEVARMEEAEKAKQYLKERGYDDYIIEKIK